MILPAWLAAGIGMVAVALALDRLLLAAEARGWIYWRRRQASPGSRAAAMLELHALLEPDRRHSAEMLREETHEDDGAGGPGPEEGDGHPRG